MRNDSSPAAPHFPAQGAGQPALSSRLGLAHAQRASPPGPTAGGWVTGVIYDEDEHLVVGRAGFHGPLMTPAWSRSATPSTPRIVDAATPAQRWSYYSSAPPQSLL